MAKRYHGRKFHNSVKRSSSHKVQSVRLDVLSGLEEQRRKSQQSIQPPSSTQQPNSTSSSYSTSSEVSIRSIPGYFYDAAKKRYFPNSMRKDVVCDNPPTPIRSSNQSKKTYQPRPLPLPLPLFLLQHKRVIPFHSSSNRISNHTTLSLRWFDSRWKCEHPIQSTHVRCAMNSSEGLFLGSNGWILHYGFPNGVLNRLCNRIRVSSDMNMNTNTNMNIGSFCEVLSICEGYGLVCDRGITRLVHYDDNKSIPMEGEWMCICRSRFFHSSIHEYPSNSSGNVIVCGDHIRIYSERNSRENENEHENENENETTTHSHSHSHSHLHLLHHFPISIPHSTNHSKIHHHSHQHQHQQINSNSNSNSNVCVCAWSNPTCTELVCGLRDGHLLLISSELSNDNSSLSSPFTHSIWKFRHCVRCVSGSQSIQWKRNDINRDVNNDNSFTHVAGVCACDLEGHVMIGVRLSSTHWTCREIHGICAKCVWCNEEEVVCVCEDGVWIVSWYGDLLRCVYNHSFQTSFLCGNDAVLVIVEENGILHWCSRH